MHLVVDGYCDDPDRLRDADVVQRFLNEHPSAIGMTKISPPHVYTYHGRVPDDWGVSGFVLIAESHISVHTFPERRYVNIDVFSCKEFDAEASLRAIKATFSLTDARVWTLERGLDYSTPRSAYQGMVRERVSLIPDVGTGDAR